MSKWDRRYRRQKRREAIKEFFTNKNTLRIRELERINEEFKMNFRKQTNDHFKLMEDVRRLEKIVGVEQNRMRSLSLEIWRERNPQGKFPKGAKVKHENPVYKDKEFVVTEVDKLPFMDANPRIPGMPYTYTYTIFDGVNKVVRSVEEKWLSFKNEEG